MTISLLTFAACGNDDSTLASKSDDTTTIDQQTLDRATQVLREGLQSDAFWPSIHAAEGLTLVGYGSHVKEFLAPALLAASDDRERAGIARELARAGDESQTAVLTKLLLKNDAYSIVHAVEGLYKIGAVGDLDAMRAASHSSDNPAIAVFAAGALVQSGDAGAADTVREIYKNGDNRSMRLGALVLGQIGTRGDIALLQSRIDDAPDELTLSYIQHALALLGDEAGLEQLVANLNSENPTVRTNAASYASIADVSLVSPRLAEMLDDPHADARYRASQTLLLLAGQQR